MGSQFRDQGLNLGHSSEIPEKRKSRIGRLTDLFFFFLSHAAGHKGFPGGSDSKAPVCNAGNPGSVPELGRSSGEGNGSPLQYSCLENSMDGGAW